MLQAIITALGRAFIEGVEQGIVKGLVSKAITPEAIGEVAGTNNAATMEKLITNASNSPTEEPAKRQWYEVVDINSDTWYLFNLGEEDAYKDGIHSWANFLAGDIPKKYSSKSTTGDVPFTLGALAARDRIDIVVSSLSILNRGFDRDKVLDAIRESVAGSLKGFIRCVAAGGGIFPES